MPYCYLIVCQLLAHVCTFQYKAATYNGQTYMTERGCVRAPGCVLLLRARVSRGLAARYINRARSTELRKTKRLLAVYSGKQTWLLASNRCQRREINMLTYSNNNVQVFLNRPLFYCNVNKLSIIK